MIAIDDEKLEKIIKTYGSKAQISKAVEELIELAEVLIKDVNKGICDHWELLEELADVEIMLKQLRIIYKVDDTELQGYINDKTNRTIERIEKESDCQWK